MRDLVLLEIRDKNAEIRAITDEEEYNKGMDALAEAIARVEKLSSIARKEGLLALEEEVNDLDGSMLDRYLKKMLMLVVDGTDPELVEEFSLSRYFAEDLTGFDALLYLIYLEGVLSIQQSENPYVIEEKLFTMVPEKVSEVFWDKAEKEPLLEQSKRKEEEKTELESLFEGDIPVGPDNRDYYLFKVADHALSSLDDRNMQRLLRDVENSDLAVAMKGLSGKARQNVLNNLSERLAVMIAEDMHYMGPVRLVDVEDAIMKIYSVMTKLLKADCMVSKDKDALIFFWDIFNSSRGEEVRKAEKEADDELYEILKAYEAGRNLLIDTDGG